MESLLSLYFHKSPMKNCTVQTLERDGKGSKKRDEGAKSVCSSTVPDVPSSMGHPLAAAPAILGTGRLTNISGGSQIRGSADRAGSRKIRIATPVWVASLITLSNPTLIPNPNHTLIPNANDSLLNLNPSRRPGSYSLLKPISHIRCEIYSREEEMISDVGVW